MKLYQAQSRPRKVKVVGTDMVVIFDHVDGKFSYCTDVSTGNLVHLAAWTEVEEIEDESSNS